MTSADFGGGTPDTSIYIAETAGGELLLAPATGAEFSGSLLPGDWLGTPWSTGGSATVSDGQVTIDGALVGSATYYSAGHSLEFVATFQPNTSQHIGFGTDLNDAPWAIFSTGYPGGKTLIARTRDGRTKNTNLGGYLGAPHRFRIDWTATSVTYYIDGVQVAVHDIAITQSMRPVASDLAGGGTLSVDWIRMSPYAGSGSYTSRVLDAAAAHWLALNWTGSQPVGTTVNFETRSGDTPNPDGTWSGWSPVSGATITSPDSRYLQYRVTLASTVASSTPVVESVTITYEGPSVAVPRCKRRCCDDTEAAGDP